MSHVTEFPAAASTVAVNHFLSRLSLKPIVPMSMRASAMENRISSYSMWWENRICLHVAIFRGDSSAARHDDRRTHGAVACGYAVRGLLRRASL